MFLFVKRPIRYRRRCDQRCRVPANVFCSADQSLWAILESTQAKITAQTEKFTYSSVFMRMINPHFRGWLFAYSTTTKLIADHLVIPVYAQIVQILEGMSAGFSGIPLAPFFSLFAVAFFAVATKSIFPVSLMEFGCRFFILTTKTYCCVSLFLWHSAFLWGCLLLVAMLLTTAWRPFLILTK